MNKLFYTWVTTACVVSFPACQDSTDLAVEATGLRMGGVAASDVVAFAIDITDCDGHPIISDHIVKLVPGQTLPGDLKTFAGQPFASDSAHHFADWFQTVPAGCYNVQATPLLALDDPTAIANSCSVARSASINIEEGKTTEVLLISQCIGTDPGALDLIATLNHDPEILSVEFPHGKFSSGAPVQMCVQASDPDSDPLRYEVLFAAGTPCFVASQDLGCFNLRCNGNGSFVPQVRVYDQMWIGGYLTDVEEILGNFGSSADSHASLDALIHIERPLPARRYSISPIAIDGFQMSDFNNAGDILGTISHDDETRQAVIYRDGTITPVPGLGDDFRVLAFNDSRTVVGSALIGDEVHTFRTHDGVVDDLGLLDGASTFPEDINNAGVIVGRTLTFPAHGFIYQDGMMHSFLSDRVFAMPHAINDAGEIAGQTNWPDEGYLTHAFSYSGGTLHNLGSFGGTTSRAYEINNLGHVVGFTDNTGDFPSDYHAYFYADGVLQNLGTLGGEFATALGINDADEIVGYSQLDESSDHAAFVVLNSTMYKLQDLTDASGAPWQLQDAKAINNVGQIVGAGRFHGEWFTYLATPID